MVKFFPIFLKVLELFEFRLVWLIIGTSFALLTRNYECQPHKGSPHLQTQLQDGFRLTFSLISFSFLSFPVHSTGFSFCFFPGFLAIFIFLPLNNDNKFNAIILKTQFSAEAKSGTSQKHRKIKTSRILTILSKTHQQTCNFGIFSIFSHLNIYMYIYIYVY